jgi:thiamine-monophosphate kinase
VAANKRPGEFALIERYFRPLATDRGAFNLADDAALYRQRPDDDLVLTTDMVAAGVHFFADDPPESIARKALRVNLSDLVAKGADPFGYLLSLALPAGWTEAWMKRFTAALAADQKAYVSGTIGDGALGLRLRRGKVGAKARGAKHLLDRYLHPQPRMTLAPVLRTYASAAMDVSDGLVGDLAHICEASGVGAEIEADDVPLSPAAAGMLVADRHLLATILNGGDDYEILATVPESAATAFVAEAEVAGVPVARIGRIMAGKGPPVVRNPAGKTIKIASASHTHF